MPRGPWTDSPRAWTLPCSALPCPALHRPQVRNTGPQKSILREASFPALKRFAEVRPRAAPNPSTRSPTLPGPSPRDARVPWQLEAAHRGGERPELCCDSCACPAPTPAAREGRVPTLRRACGRHRTLGATPAPGTLAPHLFSSRELQCKLATLSPEPPMAFPSGTGQCVCVWWWWGDLHLFGHLGGAGALLPGVSDVSRDEGKRARAYSQVQRRVSTHLQSV